MGLDDFEQPNTDWMAELKDRAEFRGFSLTHSHVAAKSHYFLIEGNTAYAVGKTHHTRVTSENKSHIYLNSAEETNWRDNQQDIPPRIEIEYDSELVDIFGIIIDHLTPNGYTDDQDNFLVLSECILEEIPESGKKELRTKRDGYRHPFGKYTNSWERLFKNLE
ncbi:uncharacterized protein Nmlp_2601 [Natronomonas moolapensis 8.8.11]|uniref:Uncharacterized protein n=1 Tax=Natronomonas moolapensis (strain DSM 18674 / CECT 7526 / JCM 14361 / 8.8.11) TaxID=268739 RepID=M1XRD8_NATM8|nr:hypothetical protein [Natronomonas moolapensis]CCQ36760.1 uncharacterized protein Nmlp_2601 [Natronomonas moolapensis 8.8.11]